MHVLLIPSHARVCGYAPHCICAHTRTHAHVDTHGVYLQHLEHHKAHVLARALQAATVNARVHAGTGRRPIHNLQGHLVLLGHRAAHFERDPVDDVKDVDNVATIIFSGSAVKCALEGM